MHIPMEENAGVAEVVVDPASVEDIRATEDEEGAEHTGSRSDLQEKIPHRVAAGT